MSDIAEFEQCYLGVSHLFGDRHLVCVMGRCFSVWVFRIEIQSVRVCVCVCVRVRACVRACVRALNWAVKRERVPLCSISPNYQLLSRGSVQKEADIQTCRFLRGMFFIFALGISSLHVYINAT